MCEDSRQQEFLKTLLDGKRLESTAMVMQELSRLKSLPAIYETIFKPALYRIGDLWQSGQISVANEHLAAAIIEAIMNELYFRIITGEHTGKTVVAACVEGELHQIGIRMVADVFEMNGWSAHFLGADTPGVDLNDFIRRTGPDALALSLSSDCRLAALEKTVEAVDREFPELFILAGGLAFREGHLQAFLSAHPKVVHLADLNQLDARLKGDWSQPRNRPPAAAGVRSGTNPAQKTIVTSAGN